MIIFNCIWYTKIQSNIISYSIKSYNLVLPHITGDFKSILIVSLCLGGGILKICLFGRVKLKEGL